MRPAQGLFSQRSLPTFGGRSLAWPSWNPSSVHLGSVLPGAQRLLPRVALGVAATLLLIAVSLGVLRSRYEGQVYPAIAVADVSLGGLPKDAALAALSERAAGIERGTVTFTYQDRTWSPALADLGISVNVEASLDEAYAVGREDDAWQRLSSAADLLQKDRAVPLRMRLDEAALTAWFDTVDGDLGLPPHDAYLAIEGATVRIEPELDGTIVDRTLARERVLAALRTMQPIAEPLPVLARIAAVRAGDLIDAQARLQAALAKPVPVSFEGQSWTLDPAELGRFVTQAYAPGMTGAQAHSVALDQQALAGWLTERLATEINRDPVDAEVGWNDGPVAINASETGVQLMPRAFAEAVGSSFFGDHGTVEIPITVLQPAVDSNKLDDLGITTRLGAGDSNYSASNPERAQNVNVGAALMNHTLIAPGEEFSFHHAVGEITAEAGFVEANVIQAERIDRGVGGGICQVSTTVFRAALLAGLPITEWWPHDYRLDFYEGDGWGPGYDASILQPEGDPFSGGNFKFLNPSESWMLVESWSDGARVWVVIYGPDLGYDVTVSDVTEGEVVAPGEGLEVVDEKLDPGTIKHTETPQEGLEVWFTRTVVGPDGELVEDGRQFYTRFKSRGNVWRVSPDMQFQSPYYTG